MSENDEDLQLALALSASMSLPTTLTPSFQPVTKNSKDGDNRRVDPPIPPLPTSVYHNVSLLGMNICYFCRQECYGPQIHIQDRLYHAECCRCSGCRGLIQGRAVINKEDSELYHLSCHEELFSMRCCACCSPLRQQYLQHPFLMDEKYCVDHVNLKMCYSCQRREPLAFTGRESFCELPDGRVHCMECMSTAILESSEAQSIYVQAVDFMEHVLHLPIPENMRDVPVHSVDYLAMNEKLVGEGHSMSTSVRGLTLSRVHGGGITEVTAVLILTGLPRELAASILAHEAFHVWIRLQSGFPLNLPPKVEEGMCQVVAAKFLHHQRTENKNLRDVFLATIERDPSEVYGDGYREAKQVVDLLLFDVVVDFIRQRRALPAV